MCVRPVLSADFVADFRRRAITDAMAGLCAEQGYRATTMTHVVTRAKTSRNTAYQHFSGREEIFFALLARSFSELITHTENACRAAGPEGRIEAGLSAVLTWVARSRLPPGPSSSRQPAPPPSPLRRYLGMITSFTALLRGNVPTKVPRPATTEESLVGGAASILRFRILNGEAERAPELLPELATFLRLPFIATDLSR